MTPRSILQMSMQELRGAVYHEVCVYVNVCRDDLIINLLKNNNRLFDFSFIHVNIDLMLRYFR